MARVGMGWRGLARVGTSGKPTLAGCAGTRMTPWAKREGMVPEAVRGAEFFFRIGHFRAFREWRLLVLAPHPSSLPLLVGCARDGVAWRPWEREDVVCA